MVVLMAMSSVQSFGSSNMPEDPYAPEFVLASHVTVNIPFKGNPLENLGMSPQDTIPIEDRTGDFLNNTSQNPFDLQDPAAVEQTVEFDPETGNYIITEKIGNDFFRPPTFMTFDEYLDHRAKEQEREYFNALSGTASGRGTTGRLDPLEKVDIKDQMIERLFGGTEVDIKPQGNIDLTFGVEFNNTQNPTLPQRAQRQGGFDFDMAIQMNVDGKIGEKLKLSTNYNTQATFDFDNTMKLEYNTDAFGEDDIIKKIEAGNVSLPLRGSLIQGSQSLFGIKTELQFGRLRLNMVASQQKSEREAITLEGGSQYQEYEVKADDYDENRHFFLTHYNRNNFEEALEELPIIKSLFTIKNIQVWVTDTRNSTEDIRDIVAISDLGETTRFTNPEQQAPPIPYATDIEGEPLPDNNANDLFEKIFSDPRSKEVNRVVDVLRSEGLQQGRDFEKVTARQLSPTEFNYHPNLGFVSLNVNIQPDQVVGVAFEYSYQDKIYRVGQIAEDQNRATDSVTQNVLFVKMLKSTIQPVDLPTWDLMMKNVYNIGAYNVSRQDFELGIYYEDPGEGIKQFMPAQGLSDKPLLRVFNLDQLNVQLDPVPDGVFDFVEGLTINTRTGRIMFPVLEPFGSSLEAELTTDADKRRFVYDELYDMTLFNAREFQEYNRFLIKGSYKSSVTSEITLPGFNIPEETIVVYSGGARLVLGRDYVIEGNKVKITNDAYLNSGAPIKIEFEDNSLFGFQTKTMLGVRADYELNKNLTLGATYLHLFERPYTQKVNIGDDPINNRIYGFDINYSKDAPWLTRMVDKLPFYSTKEMSSINFTAETAALRPGHARAINENSATDGDNEKGGIVYIDDFEGAVTPINLTSPFVGVNGWMMASVPRDNQNSSNPIFPEAFLNDTTLAGVNRAHLSWYSIDQGINSGDPNPYSAVIQQTEVFPNRTQQNTFGAQLLRSLDLAFDPTRRGPYAFDPPDGTQYSAGINSDGTLKDPESRWAGIMRQMTTNDFQSSNIEFLEFWLMSPYMDTTGSGGGNPDAAGGMMNGELVINFGNVSEDIMPDSRKFFENGLPGPNTQGLRVTETGWGRIPLTPQITNNFDTDAANRAAQDVGLDGYNDAGERQKFEYYLNSLTNRVTPAVEQAIRNDPSNDNFFHFRDFPDGTPISKRYDRYFGLEGNTPINQGQSLTRSATTVPDGEDLDGDRTVNETESYFEYRVPIVYDPNEAGGRGMNLNDNPFITEGRVSESGRVYYRFRIPLNLLDSDPNFRRVGGIRDFRSIRFMRMYLTGFQKPVNMRFATLELVRSQWRRYSRQLSDEACPGFDLEEFDKTTFDINAVNIEENSERQPFGYALPPGISREQALGVNLNALQNEQALSVRICELGDGDARGIFKNTELDLRVLKKLKMFLHAEKTRTCGIGQEDLEDGDLNVFIRLGSDINSNFYEYEIPITLSRNDSMVATRDRAYPRIVWPEANDISVDFEVLKNLKDERNKSSFGVGQLYEAITTIDPNRPDAILRIKGNPNLGLIKTVMIGVRNPIAPDGDCDPYDTKSIEIWVNELRAFGLDERGGVAGLARMDLQLADLGTISLSGQASSIGFGGLDQQLNDRQKERKTQYDIAGNIMLSKFLPEKTGLSLPFYFQYSKEVSTPQFDPYDLDLELDKKLKNLDNPAERDSIKDAAQTVKIIKSYNFTNVRKERLRQDKPPMPWDISNFSFTYAFDQTTQHDPIVENDVLTRRRGAIDYNYVRPVTYIEPLKNVIKSKHLKFLANMNLNPLPNSFAFSTDLDRRFNVTKYRFAGDNPLFNTYYNKQFIWNRTYDVQWDLTRNLKIQFNADNNAIIDEPEETKMQQRNLLDPTDPLYISDIDSYRRDSIWTGLKNFGRNKHYQHGLNVTYKVPLDDFPFLDWVGVKASYRSTYNWDAASLTPSAQSQGNIISNTQSRQINGDIDFEKLYNYFPYLKKINNPPRKGRSGTSTRPGGRSSTGKEDSSGKKDKKSDRKNKKGDPGADKKSNKADKDKRKKDRQPSQFERALIRPLMAVRKARLNYQEDFGTTIPGFLPQSELFGQQDFSAPGWGFVAGLQPNINQNDYYTDKDWLHNNWQWITGDPLLNKLVLQTNSQKMDGKLTIEPFKDFRIDIEASRTVQQNHEEDYRRKTISDPTNPEFRVQDDMTHQNISDFGSFQVSYLAGLNTLFEKDVFGLFETFKDNRVVIANRLSNDPAGSHDIEAYALEGYPRGYGPEQGDVALPAFIAAYTGKDPNTVEVSADYMSNVLKKSLPNPNWRLTYNGLSKLAPFEEYFQSIAISHAYRSTLSVSSFRTHSFYDVNNPLKLDDGPDGKLDYFVRFRVPDIGIQEQFSPLFGIDARLKNNMSFKAEVSKSRTLTLDLGGSNISETLAQDITVGFGYKLKDVSFGFLASKKKKKSNARKKEEDKKPGTSGGRAGRRSANEPGSLDITFDFSIRDDETNQYFIVEESRFPTRGNRTVSILPQATYQLNKQLSLRFFFDYRHQEPKTTQGYPTTNVRSGVTVRFSLE